MKIAVVADLHIGAGPDLHPDRLAHQQMMWRRLCEEMATLKAELVVIAGDVFHRRKPTPAENIAFLAGLDMLRSYDIPVLAIDGNHDVSTAAEPSTIAVFAGAAIVARHGVRHVRTAKLLTHMSRRGETVEIACLPWTPAAEFRSHQAELDPAAANLPVSLLLEQTAAGLRAECESSHPLLVLHWSMAGAKTPTGATVDEFRETTLNTAALADQQWGAVLAGHIHNPMVLREPMIGYCGSPWVVDYGETEVAHGWWLLEGDGESEWDRRYVANREEYPFVTHTLDLTDTAGYPQLPRDWDVRGAVVRVLIRCSEAQAADLDVAAMRRSLVDDHGARHVYQIRVDQVRVERKGRVEVEALSPDEALERWLAQENDREPIAVDVWPKHRDFMDQLA